MNPASNLVLVGPMGAGKTCIGRRLAEHFALQLADVDREVEQHAGASIATIFECEGEAGFRQRERSLIEALVCRSGLLVATGGGAVLDPANRRDLRRGGFVVHLQLTPGQQLERLERDTTRPLLARPDRDRVLRDLAVARDPLYREIADLGFATGGLTADQAAAQLALELESRWQRPGVAA
ncbi:MAG: shikimate kinase [Pseudomonadota bacterium]|nr:shikimate kinase [Pseudomonadota bacterium]